MNFPYLERPQPQTASRRRRTSSARDWLLPGALYVAGVLVFADAQTVATAALAGVTTVLMVIGWRSGRLRATGWTLVLLLSAFTADSLWWAGFAPFDRSDEWEAIPQTPFVLIALPISMAVVALGVIARAGWYDARGR